MPRRSPFVYVALLLPVVALAIFFWWLFSSRNAGPYWVKPWQMHRFSGVRGPAGRSVVAPPEPTSWKQYSSGSRSRLAILLTDTNCAWLGVAHGLKSAGVPFLITTNHAQALQHRVVLVYPVVSGQTMSVEALRAVAAHPRNGGTLLAMTVLGGGLEEVCGFARAEPSKKHFEVHFNATNTLTAGFNEPQERTIRIADPKHAELTAGTYAYLGPQSTPLAVYDDLTPAITGRRFESGGAAYAFGVDFGHLALVGFNNREEHIARSYVNQFEPTLDVLLRLVKNLYVAGESGGGVTLGTVPSARALSVMITHDIDYTRSLSNAVTYAKFEKDSGIRATYFLQVKYVRDYSDDIFFHAAGIPYVRQLAAMRMEVASHSISHSPVYATFPPGDGAEQYPAYAPFVQDQATTYNGSVLGELRVSKFLIEHFDGQKVVSFRPGFLSNPYSLPQSLHATGYRFSSSVTANNSLTHLLFQLTHDRRRQAETPIFEFPVTIEDEEKPKMGERVPQAVAVARQVARYGGSFVVLIHPDVLDHKLEFERRFVAAVKDAAWFGTVAEFGDWWAARNEVALDTAAQDRFKVVQLDIPKRIRGLSLQGLSGYALQSVEPATVRIGQANGQFVLDEAQGRVRLVFVR